MVLCNYVFSNYFSCSNPSLHSGCAGDVGLSGDVETQSCLFLCDNLFFFFFLMSFHLFNVLKLDISCDASTFRV